MNELEVVISLAMSEEGYLEKKSNKDLDDKVKNAGSNNYTKYARDLDKLGDFYNGKKQGYPWCDVFVDWLFVKCFGEDRARELLCQPKKSLGAGVGYSAKYYKQHNQFYTKPKVGDQIFFKDYSHTGIVYKVDSTYVYTIEGNTSSAAGVVNNGGCVRMKKYKIKGSNIEGYGRPKYKSSEQPKHTYQGEFPTLPKRGYFKKGDKGKEVIKVQALLNWACDGVALTLDGSYGPASFSKAKVFEKLVGNKANGLFGKNDLAKAKTFEK